MASSLSSQPLPVAGVWSREWEQDPLGDEATADRTTLVLWIQSSLSGAYIDLRLPFTSPGHSPANAQTAGIVPRPSAIAGVGMSTEAKTTLLAKQELMDALVQQKSFAGNLKFELGDTTESKEALQKDPILASLAAQQSAIIPLCTCFWRREFDIQPPSGSLDIGVCASEESQRSDGSLFMRETGQHGSYAEGWVRQGNTEQGPFLALQLVQEEHDGMRASRKGFFVRAGNRFAYAVGRPTNNKLSVELQFAVEKSLTEAVSRWDKESILDIAIGRYIALAGEVVDTHWMIQHSTQPELVGCKLVGDLETDKLCCSHFRKVAETCQIGDQLEQVLCGGGVRRWKIDEMSDNKLLPMSSDRLNFHSYEIGRATKVVNKYL